MQKILCIIAIPLWMATMIVIFIPLGLISLVFDEQDNTNELDERLQNL
jgi:hypothetical protein